MDPKLPYDDIPEPEPEPTFRVITRAPFIKWRDQPKGYTVTGIWVGRRPSKTDFGDLGVLQAPDGRETSFGVPVALEGELARIPVGTLCQIRYDGMVQGKKGTRYHSFTVSVATDAEIPERRDRWTR